MKEAPQNWEEDTLEVSAGCYRVSFKDLDGRIVERTGGDPDATRQMCINDIEEIEESLKKRQY